MNKRFSKFMLTSASALALLAAYPSVASTAEVVGFDLPAITAEAATQGNAFVRVVRALPSVANITSADAASVRAARNLYNSLPNAEKANADVTRWAGYLADKEAALPVDHVRNFLLESRVLPNVAEINAMNAKEFAQAKVDLQAARASYAQLTNAEKANADVARWAGYLTVKEDAFGVTFILAAKDLPSMDAIGKMDAKELVAVQEDIDSVRELYDALSDVAKADKEVARWIGYVDQKEEAVEAAAVVAVDSVKAINAKTIEVTFNKAVEDTAATVEVVRGNFKQNVTVNWAADRKSVQLVGASNFQPATYSVTVKGKDLALTSSVAIEAQKVATIEILDDVAVLSDNPNGLITDLTATVGYVVKDQYGTDITTTTDLTTNDGTNVKVDKKGKVTLKGLTGKRVGDLVPVVLVHAASGTTTSATVTLSAAATVADVSVEGVYNDKGEKVELKDNTKADSAFLVVNLKDQYGNDITPASANAEATGVIVTNTNPLVAKLINDKVTTTKIDRKDKFVVKFQKLDNNNEFKGGSAELLFISTMDGKTFKHTVNVVETKTTDAVTVSQPEHAINGEDVLLPITVLDKEGNTITDRDLLSHTTKGIKVNGNPAVKPNITVKDGQVFYNLGKATAAADSYVTATVATSTYKVATVTYKVTAKAKPVAVRGLKNSLVLKANADREITFADVNVEDQYGRTMKALTSEYTVKVKEITGDDKVVTVADNIVKAGGKNGTATITISLHDSGKEVANSAVEQQVRVTDGKEYSDFEIATIGKVQAFDVESAGAKEFTVNGLLNGGKVALTPGANQEYTAEVVGLPNAVTGNKISISKSDITTANKVADKEFTLRVTINATGKVLEQKFVVSADEAKTEDFFFTTTEADASKYDDAKAITEAVANVGAEGYTIATQIVKGEDKTDLNIATVDQYGNKNIIKAAGIVTIVPEKVSDVTVTGNGTANANAKLNADVEKTTLTVKVKEGNATKELKVTLNKVVTL